MQSNVQIKCNPYQATNGILHRTRTLDHQVSPVMWSCSIKAAIDRKTGGWLGRIQRRQASAKVQGWVRYCDGRLGLCAAAGPSRGTQEGRLYLSDPVPYWSPAQETYTVYVSGQQVSESLSWAALQGYTVAKAIQKVG